MNMRIKLSTVLILVTGCIVFALDLRPRKLEKCVYFYENGEYEKSIDSLKVLLSISGKGDGEMLVEINKYLGFAYIMTDDIPEAKKYFVEMLTLDPRKKLDPVMVPPNIYSVFREVRLEQDLQAEKKKKRLNYYWITGGAAAVASGGLIYFLMTSNAEPVAEEPETGGVKFGWDVEQ